MRTLRIVLAALLLAPALGLLPGRAAPPERSRYAVQGALPAGTNVLARYGTTSIVDITETEASALRRAGRQLEALPDAHKIKLNRLTFDTRRALSKIPRSLVSGPTATTWLVQFVGPIDASWLDALRAVGARVATHGYIPENAWVVRARPETIRRAQGFSFVQAAVPLHPWFRISPRLDGLKGVQQVRVLLSDDASTAVMASKIKAMGAIELGRVDQQDVKLLRLNVAASMIDRIARMDGVLWVEPSLPLKLHNDHAADTLGVRPVWNGFPEAPGGLQGEGEIVAVADTGLDTGKLSTMHPDFRSHILELQAFGRKGDPSDPDGHGTHTAGSVVGDGSAWLSADLGGCILACDPDNAPKGMAPKARLVFQSIADAEGALAGVPEDPGELYGAAYDVGARVHSNSYGSDAAGAYDLQAMLLDRFIETHPDMLITFSAGNSGVDLGLNGIIDLGSIGSPATAKNTMSIGASEDNRGAVFSTGDLGDALLGVQAGLPTYTTYALFYIPPAGIPIETDYMSNNSEGMVAFSSRGPTLDGRIKPDIVAIGTNVLSTRTSLLPPEDIELHYWGRASTGSSASEPKAGDYPTTLDPYYAFVGGTSMSNPLTAGAATVVRQYLRRVRGFGDPSAALVKTAMTAGAYELQGQYPGLFRDVDARPDFSEGWGRVDVANTIAPDGPAHAYFYDDPVGLRTAGVARYTIDVTDTTVPLRVQLGWTDVTANVLALKTLVNDLDLIVTAPDGTVYRGNKFSERADTVTPSAPNPADGNHIDNIEGITVPANAVQAGKWTVDVKGYTVPAAPQKFALVLHGGIASAPAGAIHLDAASYKTGGRAPKLVVSDPGRNHTGIRDAVKVLVSSGSSAAGIPVTLNEDGSTPGVFSGEFHLGTPAAASAASGIVASAHGQKLRATYVDSAGHVLTAEALVDNVAPKVSDVKLEATTPFGFSLAFGSSEPAFGNIDIGPSPGTFTSSATTVAITQEHKITALGLDDAKRYYFRARATDDPGNVGVDDSSHELFSVRTLRSVLEYAYDAEAETGWTHQANPDNSAAAEDLWHLSSRKDAVHGGKTAWFFGSEDPNTNYPAGADAFLDSPELTRKSAAWAILRFWANYDAEKGFDGLNLLASDDGGSTYRTVPILSTGPPTGVGLASAQIDGNSKGYRLIEGDLSGFKGQTIRIRFQFTSDGGVEKAGAAVDDVSVLGSELAPVKAVLKAAASQGSSVEGVQIGTLTLSSASDWVRVDRLEVRRTGDATDADVPAVILTFPDGREATAKFSNGIAVLEGLAFDGSSAEPGLATVSLRVAASAVNGRVAGLAIDTGAAKAAAPDVLAAGTLRLAQIAVTGGPGGLPATGVTPLEPLALLLLLAAAVAFRGIRARRS